MTHHPPTGALVAALSLSLAACGRPGAATRRSGAASSGGSGAATLVATSEEPPHASSALVVPRSSPEPTPAIGGGTSAVGVAAVAASDPAPSISEPAPGPVAVVLLMLGNPAAPMEVPASPRTYKLLVTADARTATIEVDDHPIGTAPIQRVYPQRAQLQAAAPAARWPPVSVRGSPGSWPTQPPARARPGLLPPGGGAAPPFRDDREPVNASTLNPNGAPIID